MLPEPDWSDSVAVIRRLADIFPARQAVFWSGAGVSVDPPTRGPKGYDLTKRALDSGFAPDTLDRILACYSDLSIARPFPRLETILDVFSEIHGIPAVLDMLSDLEMAQPNANHHFFSDHLRHGGAHITANFDTYIERARSSGEGPWPLHFHGSLSTEEGGLPFGATLSGIQHGLTAVMKRNIGAALDPAVPKLLVFVGYSASDYFDVLPYFRDFTARADLSTITILWVYHVAVGTEAPDTSHLINPRTVLTLFAAAGASVYEVALQTSAALKTFGARWKIDYREVDVVPLQGHWVAKLAKDRARQDDASLSLFARMGLHSAVVDILAVKGGPQTPVEHGYFAHAQWAAGRYRDAERQWHLATPGHDTRSELARLDRSGACFWLRGQYRRAERILRHAVEIAHHAAEVEPEQRALVAETFGRVLTHMRRLPDVRILATRARVRYALAHLPDPDHEESRRLFDPHTLAKLASVRTNLGAPAPMKSTFASSSQELGETEALHAALNYRHGDIRHRAATGTTPAPEVYRALQQDFCAIGARADAFRVLLLPGAEVVFTYFTFLSAIRGIDFSWWHRARLSLGFGFKRLIHLARVVVVRASRGRGRPRPR